MIHQRPKNRFLRPVFLGLVLLMAGFCQLSATSTTTQPPRYTLSQLQASLLERNLDLRKQQQELVRSLLDVKDARAAFWPVIELQASASYMENPPLGPIVMSSEDLLSGFDWPVGFQPQPTGNYITLYEGMENTLYDFGLTLQQPLFTWGKLPAAVKLYQQVATVRQLQLDARKDELLTELDTRVTASHYLSTIRGLLASQNERARRLLEIVTHAADNGLLLAQDVSEAKVQTLNVELAMLEVDSELERQMLAIRKLTGVGTLMASDLQHTPDERTFAGFLDRDPYGLEQLALAPQKSSLRAMQALEQVARLAEDLARAASYGKPDIALNVALGYSGPRLPFVETDWYRQDDYSFTVSIGLRTTIWDGGKKLNAIRRTASSTLSAQLDTEQLQLTLAQTVREELLKLRMAWSSIGYQDLLVQTLKERVDQQRLLVDIGYGDEQSLIQAQIAETNARIDREKKKLELATAYFALRFLTQAP
jgi:outer membrane protein TolC